MEKTFSIEAYSPKQLRALYKVSKRTWCSWIAPIREKIGELKGKTYTPKQVETIVEHLGEPNND